MAANLLGYALYAVGILALLHSGYSAIEHLAYLKLVDKHESHLPIEIVVECLASIFLCILGAVYVAGDLKPIALDTELSKINLDYLESRPSFRTLHHRGKVLLRQ
ncbi:magnesium transporter [Polychytrium aggregatum]|uniref:magnesium transporter n=1 Tax=Polychytrium aggregatum TaxID=110093 RepID=UPI0022FEA69C|nr:magnesium transporter [Polychytrium aggregatum]KAI9209900.1 magnesium transporter [Polychytrium aggregatum]